MNEDREVTHTPEPPAYVWLVILEASETLREVFTHRALAERYISRTLLDNPRTRFTVGMFRTKVRED